MGSSWSWLYGSWVYNYLCNQCLSPLILWVQILFMARCTWYNIMWYSLSVTWDRLVVFFGFLHQLNWPPQYNWNIVESGIKNQTKPSWRKSWDDFFYLFVIIKFYIADDAIIYYFLMFNFVSNTKKEQFFLAHLTQRVMWRYCHHLASVR